MCRSALVSPRATLKSMPRSASREPYALRRPSTSIAASIDLIMATSLQRACSAAASTSGRTRRACWSPRRTTAAQGGAAAARVHPPGARPDGRRDDPAGADRRDRRRRRRAARAGRAGRREHDPHRRHRRHPPAPPTATSSSRHARAGGVEVCVLDGEEEARLAFLGATRTLGRPLPGRVGGRRRRRRLDRDRRRDARRRRRVVGASFAFGSGFLADALPGRRPAHARPSSTRSARTRRGVLEGIAPPPVDTAVAVGGSAASLRRLVGDGSTPRDARSARCACSPTAPAADVATPLRPRRRSACG